MLAFMVHNNFLFQQQLKSPLQRQGMASNLIFKGTIINLSQTCAILKRGPHPQEVCFFLRYDGPLGVFTSKQKFIPFYFFNSYEEENSDEGKQGKTVVRESEGESDKRDVSLALYPKMSQFKTPLLHFLVTHRAQHCDCPSVLEQAVVYSIKLLPATLLSPMLLAWLDSSHPPGFRLYSFLKEHLTPEVGPTFPVVPQPSTFLAPLQHFPQFVTDQSICLILSDSPTKT